VAAGIAVEPSERLQWLREQHARGMLAEAQLFLLGRSLGLSNAELGLRFSKTEGAVRRDVGRLEGSILLSVGSTDRRLMGWWCAAHLGCCLRDARSWLDGLGARGGGAIAMSISKWIETSWKPA
jgi:hypothetical protein